MGELREGRESEAHEARRHLPRDRREHDLRVRGISDDGGLHGGAANLHRRGPRVRLGSQERSMDRPGLSLQPRRGPIVGIAIREWRTRPSVDARTGRLVGLVRGRRRNR